MANLILGSILISGTIVGAWAAVRLYKRGRSGGAVFVIAMIAFGFRLYAAADPFLHPWDERYHSLVAKNMMSHPFRPTLYENPALPYDYTNWGRNHIWVHKPPLALWLMAGSMKLFGINEISVRLPSLLLSVFGVFLIYALGTRLFDRRTGLLGAFFQAVNWMLINLAAGREATDHIDTALITFVELGIFLAVIYADKPRPAYLVLTGAAAGLGFLAKSFPALLVFAVLAFLLIGRERPRVVAARVGLAFAAFLAVALPWEIYIRFAFPHEASWEARYNLIMHIMDPLEQHSGSIFYHFLHAPNIFGFGISFAVIWFMWHLVKERRDSRLRAVALWLILPYLIFSLVATKMNGYVMIGSGAAFLIEGAFLSRLWGARQSPESRSMATAVVLLLALLPLGRSLESVGLSRYAERRSSWPATWAARLKSLPQKIGNVNAVLFNFDDPIEVMFYTPYTVYSGVPTNEEVDRVLGQNRKVFIHDGENLPAALRGRTDVTILPRMDAGFSWDLDPNARTGAKKRR